MAAIQRRRIISLCASTRHASRRELSTSFRSLAGPARKAPPLDKDALQENSSVSSQRKATVSGNTHPLWQDVADQGQMKEFPDNLLATKDIGLPVAFSEKHQAIFRVFGVPRSVEKDFKFLSKPFSVVRKSTLDLIQLLGSSNKSGPRVVITGAPGSGKSYSLLQAISHCTASGWIVLSIPRAIDLINCTTPYSYDPQAQIFLQPALSATLLRRLKETGHLALDELKMETELPPEKLPPGTPKVGASINQLIDFGVREVSLAPFVLELVLSELSSQTKYPFLLAVDDFQALYCQSLYKTPQFLPVESHHLSVPRLLLEYACGSRKINKGAMLGALSLYNTSYLPTTEIYEALNLDLTHGKRPGAYVKRSEALQHYATGLQAFPLPSRLEISEAAGIFDAWHKDRALHSTPSDQLFLSKYCESDGNAREFVWRGLMKTLDT